MLINRLRRLCAMLVLAPLGGCAQPCGASGGLCAPPQPTTSTLATLASAAAQSGERPGAGRVQQPDPPAQAILPAPPSATVRIALLVPLQSKHFKVPASAVRDGFMAAYERDHDGAQVDLIPTGDDIEDTRAAYERAASTHDIVVGPLARSAVNAIASGTVTRATIALNHPDSGIALPPLMLAIGLSIEDEARQAADWAAQEQPDGRALILSGNEPWQQRMAEAFELRWSELGRNAHREELVLEGGHIDPDAIDLVRTRMEIDPPRLIFAALDATQLRQVRAVLGTATTCYAASPANSGPAGGSPIAELDGLRLLDLPWEVQPGHGAVARYPRWPDSSHTLDMDRLYALGIDAYRLARALAREPGKEAELDGVTGKLAANLAAPASFRRTEAAVVYRDGAFHVPEPER